MNATNTIATDLFYKIRSRFSGLKLGTAEAAITINPEQARFFDFDYKQDDTVIGHVSISLAEENSMKVYFSSGITESMDDSQKKGWYGFLRELRQFAKRRLMAFDTRDIAKDNLDKRDYVFLSQYNKPQPKDGTQITKSVGESIMNEGNMYGTRTMSYQKLLDTRLIIKHSHALLDDQQPGARTRNISALFVENQIGERFKYPFIHLAGARCMQRHVANGGLPYDDIGKSIINMSEQIAQLKSFSNYVVRNDLMNSETNDIVQKSREKLESLKEQIAKLSKQSHYEAYKENFQAQQNYEVPQEVVEDYINKFTVKNFKEDIKSVFPLIYKLMQEETTIGYNDIVEMTDNEQINDEVEIVGEDPFEKFEGWIMGLGEESSIVSDDDEEKSKAIDDLQQLITQHFPAGADGSNAIESLEGIIDDDDLFRQIKEVAKEDPDQCVRPLIKNWIEENAPDLLDPNSEKTLDFGDMEEEPADDQEEAPPADQAAEPEEQPQMASIDPKPSRQKLNVQELAEFIHSFYDGESGTFPKGPEGVCTMVGKKFGEQAEQVARRFVERMAPMQTTENNPELKELARIRELSGLKNEAGGYSPDDHPQTKDYGTGEEEDEDDDQKSEGTVAEDGDDLEDLRAELRDAYQMMYDSASEGVDQTDHIADELGDFFDAVEESGDESIQQGYEMVRGTADTDPEEQAEALRQAMRLLDPPEPDVEIDRESIELEAIKRLSGIAQGLGY